MNDSILKWFACYKRTKHNIGGCEFCPLSRYIFSIYLEMPLEFKIKYPPCSARVAYLIHETHTLNKAHLIDMLNCSDSCDELKEIVDLIKIRKMSQDIE